VFLYGEAFCCPVADVCPARESYVAGPTIANALIALPVFVLFGNRLLFISFSLVLKSND
jgi:hypothetical protein